MRHENTYVENIKSVKESRERLAAEEAKRIQEALDARDAQNRSRLAIREMRERKSREHGAIMETARNEALSTIVKAIYITAMNEQEALSDEGIILAESMVDNWIKESGGASKILGKVGNDSYLLSRITQIVEDTAEKEVNDIENADKDLNESIIHTMNEAIDAKQYHPVYLISMSYKSALEKPIEIVTGSKYAHSTVVVDNDFNHMYSFNGDKSKTLAGKFLGGFSAEPLSLFKKINPQGLFTVSVLFLKNSDYNKLKTVLNKYKNNPIDTHYNFKGLLNIPIKRENVTRANTMFCSQFVDYIFKSININVTGKASSIVTPRDIAEIRHKKVYNIYTGTIGDFDVKKVMNLTKKLSEKVRTDYITESEFEYVEMAEILAEEVSAEAQEADATTEMSPRKKKEEALKAAKDYIKDAGTRSINDFIGKVVGAAQSSAVKKAEDKEEEKAAENEAPVEDSGEEKAAETPAPEGKEDEVPAKNTEDKSTEAPASEEKEDEAPAKDSEEEKAPADTSTDETKSDSDTTEKEEVKADDAVVEKDETKASAEQDKEDTEDAKDEEKKAEDDEEIDLDSIPSDDSEDNKDSKADNSDDAESTKASEDNDKDSENNDSDDQSTEAPEDDAVSDDKEKEEDNSLDDSEDSEEKEAEDKAKEVSDDDVDKELGSEPLDDDGIDQDTTVDGDTENKGQIFDDLEKEDDVQKAIDTIKTRVADAEETFIRNNAEDKKKMDEILNRISSNVKTVEDLAGKDKAKEAVAKEAITINKRKYDAIINERELTIFEKMTRKLGSGIIKNAAVKESYMTESGSLDVDKVVESSKVMYGFLETLNTLRLENVNEKYIINVLKNMD